MSLNLCRNVKVGYEKDRKLYACKKHVHCMPIQNVEAVINKKEMYILLSPFFIINGDFYGFDEALNIFEVQINIMMDNNHL